MVHSSQADRPDVHHTCPPPPLPGHSSVLRRRLPAVVHHRTGVHSGLLAPNSSSNCSTATDGHLVAVHPGRDVVADPHKDSDTVVPRHMALDRDQVHRVLLVRRDHHRYPPTWSQWHQLAADSAVAVSLLPMTSWSCCSRILWPPLQHWDC